LGRGCYLVGEVAILIREAAHPNQYDQCGQNTVIMYINFELKPIPLSLGICHYLSLCTIL